MRGFLLSLEALVVVGVLLLVALFLSGITVTTTPELKYERLYITAKDVLNVLENAKISETQNVPTLNALRDQGVIVDVNGSLLDAIGFLWSTGNVSLAQNLTSEIFAMILNDSELNYQLVMGNTTLVEKNSSASTFIAKLSTVASGYEVGKPVSGFVARAYITQTSKEDRAYGFFGGYVGDGNLTKTIILPNLDAALSAELEFDVGTNFSLYINGNYSGDFIKTANGNLSADNWFVDSSYLSYFVPGTNNISINFTDRANNFIGGGFVKVTFNTTELVVLSETAFGSNATDRYQFPGINGIINLFDSFYIPGNLTNLSVYLDYTSEYDIFLTIGNQTVYEDNDTAPKQITIPNANLSTLFNYSALSDTTIPIRLGTESLELIGGGLGNLDTSLITDRTGSMTACDVDANCSEPNLCDSNPSGGCHANRHLVALEADRAFVDVVTSTQGNNIGLIGYGATAAPPCSFAEISSDNATLQAHLDDYNYNNIWQTCGWTCISCGIDGATVHLTEYETLYGLNKVSDSNTTPQHVGDTGPVAINVTFDMDVDLSRFVKGRIIILATNIDVASGYQDCVFLNNNYLGRICDADGTAETSWHTCTYPLKSEWVVDGENIITITGANTNSCFDTSGEQDDWDFKSVEMSIWELNNLTPVHHETFDSTQVELNSLDSISYTEYADLWELQTDLPYPIDFTSGYNTTANTFGLGNGDDGWDWDTENGAGPYSFDDDADYNGVQNGKLDVDIQTSPGSRNNCNNRDCSVAYGIEVNITQSLYDQTLAGEQIYVSFDYVWDGNDDPFESSDQVWIKGQWISPTSGTHWLGSTLDSGDSGSDGDPEIATEDNPDTDFNGFFSQNITPWIEGPGMYYLSFGGKVRGSATNEYGSFRFDEVAVGIFNGTIPGIQNRYNFSFDVENKSKVKAAQVEFEALDIELNFYDCVFVNNKLIGQISEQKWNGSPTWQEILFDIPIAWIVNGTNNVTFTGGTTAGCERTGQNDNWQLRNINISYVLTNESYDYDRTKSMLVMSDGEANTKIGDCQNYGSGSCPTVSGGETASEETIRKACEAHNDHGIRIYTVAFGDVGSTAIDTLNQSAGCDDYDNFYTSNNKDDLVTIYKNIAQSMINISFKAQSIVAAGNVSLNNTLSSESYIAYDYVSTIPSHQFGEVTFNFESLPLRNSTGSGLVTDNVTGTKEGIFFIPPQTKIIDARVTSYSSQFWTDRLYVKSENASNFTRTYWLETYGSDYSQLGDPYNIFIPTTLLSPGQNNSVKLGTGLAPTNYTGGSPDAKVIYMLRISGLNLEGYSNVFGKSAGSTVTVYYDLTGDNVFDSSVSIAYGPNPADIFDPAEDAIDDAFLRLLDNLNLLYDANPGGVGVGTVGDPYDGLNQSNPIDIQINSEVFFDSSSIRGITSLWGPAELTINVWI